MRDRGHRGSVGRHALRAALACWCAAVGCDATPAARDAADPARDVADASRPAEDARPADDTVRVDVVTDDALDGASIDDSVDGIDAPTELADAMLDVTDDDARDVTISSDVTVTSRDAGSRCPAGQVPCDDGCIAEGACCGLPASGIGTAQRRPDLRHLAVSARTVLTVDDSSESDLTSALMSDGDRLWFTYVSPICRGPATVTFVPSPSGVAMDVRRHCERVDGTVRAMTLTRDRAGMLGCFFARRDGGLAMRCGRWPSGPGSWTPSGPTYVVVSAQWPNVDGSPLTAWHIDRVAGGRLGVARFDDAMNLVSERVLAEPTADDILDSVADGDVRWLLRRPADTSRSPILERLRGDTWLPPLDVGALARIRDWSGCLARSERGVALMVQNHYGVTLLRPDASGVRGRAVFDSGAYGSGAMVPYEDGWLYAGVFEDGVYAIRMDCAGSTREDRIVLGFDNNLSRFGGLVASPDGHGYWVLATTYRNGLVRSVVRVGG